MSATIYGGMEGSALRGVSQRGVYILLEAKSLVPLGASYSYREYIFEQRRHNFHKMAARLSRLQEPRIDDQLCYKIQSWRMPSPPHVSN